MKTQSELLQEFLEEWHSGKGIKAHTSGSTGMPKELTLPIEQIKRSARRTVNFFGIKRNSRIHCAISFEFIGGKMMIARSLESGCNLTYTNPSLTPEPPSHGREIALMAVVPAQLPQILRHREEFSSVKAFLIGGSAIDSRLWDKITSSGINAWESYGMTETASHIALRRIAGTSDRRPRFVALPGVELQATREGCLKIKDGKVEVTTNDIVELASDGSFTVLGRKDDMIVTGGIKVLPSTIEQAIFPFISDLTPEYFVTSVADEVWTARIVLVVREADHERHEYTKAEIEKRLAAIPEEKLQKKLRPKEIILRASLPRTESGKLIRTLKFS